MLVSRTDIVGGFYDYKDYLTEELGILGEVKIAGDYNILNADNYAELIDPVNTGIVVPPKRPKKGKAGRSRGCWDTKGRTTSGKVALNGSETQSSHINSSRKCLVVETLTQMRKSINAGRAALKKVKNAKSKAQLKNLKSPYDSKDKLNTNAAVDRLRMALDNDEARYNAYTKKEEVKEQHLKELESIPGLKRDVVYPSVRVPGGESVGSFSTGGVSSTIPFLDEAPLHTVPRTLKEDSLGKDARENVKKLLKPKKAKEAKNVKARVQLGVKQK